MKRDIEGRKREEDKDKDSKEGPRENRRKRGKEDERESREERRKDRDRDARFFQRRNLKKEILPSMAEGAVL